MSVKEIINNIDSSKFAEAKSELKDLVKERMLQRVEDAKKALGFVSESVEEEKEEIIVKEQDEKEEESDGEESEEEEEEEVEEKKEKK